VERMPRADLLGATARIRSTLVNQDQPSVIIEEEFDYTYRCGHCGHEWTEDRSNEKLGRQSFS
jgi:hypothetical protein